MSDRKSVELLKQITGDREYINRVSGLDPSRSNGRQWDNRFSANAGIPRYDAVNDRFCKFAMRQRRSKTAKRTPGELAPIAPRRLWGHGEQPEVPRPSTGEPTSFRAAVPGGVGRSATPTANAGVSRQAGAPSADQPPSATVEALVAKSRQRLAKLWDELAVPESERVAFAQQHFGSATSETLGVLNAEIQKLVDERNTAVQVEKAIEVREGFLYLLQELTERYATSTMEKERAHRELQALVTPFRNASLDAVEAVLRWREVIKEEAQPYLWKGVSYLHKINSDLFFLANSRLRSLLDFEVTSNPLLDPRRKADSEDKGKTLPPLRRGGASLNARDAALKDLPRERLDRASAALEEEARRQSALAAQPERLTADEAAHIRGLTSEQDEKKQLVVEEDAWLKEQPAAKSAQEMENVAAVHIQASYRAYCARRFVKGKLQQHKAATKMQSTARQFLAKLHVSRLRTEVGAAKKLQSLQRGISTRTRMAALRHRHDAAVAIQRAYRAHAARRFSDMLRYVRDCAVAIQRVYRGYRDRKAVRSLVKDVQGHAAVMIQRLWRGLCIRRDPRFSRRVMSATVKLQAWFRGCLARKQATDAAVSKYAATRIQAAWRGVRGRRSANARRVAVVDASWAAHLERVTAATLKIQSAWRMVLAKARVAEIRVAAVANARSVAQEALESAKAVEREAAALRDRSALKIQSLFRGHLGRQRFRFVTLLHLTAIQIQRVVRGQFGRKRAQERFREHLVQQSLADADRLLGPSESPISTAVRAFQEDSRAESVAHRLNMSDAAEADAPKPTATTEDAAPAPSASDVDAAAARATDSPRPTQEVLTTAPEHRDSPSTDAGHSPAKSATSGTADAASEVAETAEPVHAPAARLVLQPAVLPPDAPPSERADTVAAAAASDAVADDQSAPAEIADREAAPKPADAPQDAAAVKIVNFFRHVEARHTAGRRRRALRRRDRNPQAQEIEYAVGMIQKWSRSQLQVMGARHARDLQRHARAVKQPRSAVAAQERSVAASLIQGTWKQKVVPRLHLRNAKAAAVVTDSGAHLEKTVAAGIIQRAARQRLSRASRRGATAARSTRDAAQAHASELDFAAVSIQKIARGRIARSKTAERRIVRTKSLEFERRNDAALLLQSFCRVIATKLRIRSNRAKARVAAATSQEQNTAATIVQRWTRTNLARRATARAAHARHVPSLADRQQEVDAASAKITQFFRRAVSRRHRTKRTVARTSAAAEAQEREYASHTIANAFAKPVASTSATDESHLPDTAPQHEAEPAAAAALAVTPPKGRRRSVSFNGDVKERSTILKEPELDTAGDADHEHDRAHLKSTGAAAEPPAPSLAAAPVAEAATEPATADVSVVHIAPQSSAMRHHAADHAAHHVGFSTVVADEPSEHPAVESRPVAEPEPAAPTVGEADSPSANAVVAPTAAAAPASSTDADPVAAEKKARAVRDAAACKIQCATRQRQARGELHRRRQTRDAQRREVHVREKQEAETRALERKEAENNEAKRVDHQRRALAATKIQCAYRCYNARFMRNWMLERRREQQCQRAEDDFRAVTERSACCIQMAARRFLARLEVNRRRRARDSSRSAAARDLSSHEQAATTIQCAYRCYNARFERKWRGEERQKRDALAKEQAEGAEAERVAEQAEAKRVAELRERSALTIQCAYRCYCARFALFLRRQVKRDQETASQLRSARLAQRTGRGFVSRFRTHADWAKQNNAAAELVQKEEAIARETAARAIDDAFPAEQDADL